MRIKPKRRKKSFDGREITVSVVYHPNFEVAVIKALLTKLGLVNDEMVSKFNSQCAFGNLTTMLAVQLHDYDKWFAKALSTAKTNGSVIVTVGVDILIINAIQTFLGQAITERVADAVNQANSAGMSAVNGIVKGNAEALGDLNLGGGKAAQGALNSLTAPVGSDLFNRGLSDLSDGSLRFVKGLGKMFVQNPADDIIMLGGGEFSAVQTLTFFESVGRNLDSGELAVLTPIFGSSVEYGAIRIKAGDAGVLSIGSDTDSQGRMTFLHNTRALTHGNTIYMKYAVPGSSDWNATLVHETTHVWQNQNGGTDYMTEALYAQIFGEGYEYDAAVSQGRTWFLLNPEQQAQLIEDAFASGFLQNGLPSGRWLERRPQGGFVQRIDFEQYFVNQNILGQLRSGQGAT